MGGGWWGGAAGRILAAPAAFTDLDVRIALQKPGRWLYSWLRSGSTSTATLVMPKLAPARLSQFEF